MVTFTRQQALAYRAALMSMAQGLSDEEAVTVPMLFERWQKDKNYETGLRLYYADKLYKVLQPHTSHEAYTPDIAVSLYAEVLIPDPSVISEWVQPSSTNPYMSGDKVKHNGKTWVSIVNNNVWEPGVYGWNEVEG